MALMCEGRELEAGKRKPCECGSHGRQNVNGEGCHGGKVPDFGNGALSDAAFAGRRSGYADRSRGSPLAELAQSVADLAFQGQRHPHVQSGRNRIWSRNAERRRTELATACVGGARCMVMVCGIRIRSGGYRHDGRDLGMAVAFGMHMVLAWCQNMRNFVRGHLGGQEGLDCMPVWAGVCRALQNERRCCEEYDPRHKQADVGSQRSQQSISRSG